MIAFKGAYAECTYPEAKCRVVRLEEEGKETQTFIAIFILTPAIPVGSMQFPAAP